MISRIDIKKATEILRRGGVVIYPTETAYALGCDATNARAVARIFKLKGRKIGKSLPLIVASKTMAGHLITVDPVRSLMISRFWPGPLTIVARAWRGNPPAGGPRPTDRLAPGVVAKDGTIALRVSSHPVARALSRGLGRPIVATSANRAGDPPTYTTRDAIEDLHGSPDLVLDAGRLPRRKSSTIIKIVNGRVQVLRQGSVYVPSHF